MSITCIVITGPSGDDKRHRDTRYPCQPWLESGTRYRSPSSCACAGYPLGCGVSSRLIPGMAWIIRSVLPAKFRTSVSVREGSDPLATAFVHSDHDVGEGVRPLIKIGRLIDTRLDRGVFLDVGYGFSCSHFP